MRPLTLTTHKSMLKVAGRPILEHILDSLPEEIDEVILIIGYLGHQIKAHFGDNYGGRRIYYVEQKEKLGTAHALELCRDMLGEERFMLMYGDDIIDKESIEKLLDHKLAVLVKEVEDPRRFGVVVTDTQGKVLEIVEKPEHPASNLAMTGVQVIDSRIFDYPALRSASGEYFATDSLALMVQDYDVIAERAEIWLSVATPEDLKKINENYKTYAGKL